MEANKPTRVGRRKPTVREQADKKAKRAAAPKLRSKPKQLLAKPAGRLKSFLNQSLNAKTDQPDDKLGRFMLKDRSLIPSYVKGAASELKQTVWPSLPVALRLTVAVYIFAVIFALLVAGLDWVLDKIFEEVVLNQAQGIKEFLKDLF